MLLSLLKPDSTLFICMSASLSVDKFELPWVLSSHERSGFQTQRHEFRGHVCRSMDGGFSLACVGFWGECSTIQSLRALLLLFFIFLFCF